MDKKHQCASFWRDDEGHPHISQRLMYRLTKSWKAGLNNREAAIHSGIKLSDLMEYLAYDEAFRMRSEGLQLHTRIQAKLNVSKDIEDGKSKTSTWYLERRAQDEFSTKQDMFINGTNASEEDREKAIKDILDSLGNDA